VPFEITEARHWPWGLRESQDWRKISGARVPLRSQIRTQRLGPILSGFSSRKRVAPLSEAPTDYLSASFLERVRRSYSIASNTAEDRYGRIWDTIDQRRAPVRAALLAETDEELRNIFADPVSSDLFLGVDYLCHSVLGQLPPIKNPSQETIASLGVIAGEPVRAFDEQGIADHFRGVTNKKLRLLAQACGIDTTNQSSPDSERVLQGLDTRLNQSVQFPNFPGELGLATSRGIASYRAIVALYQTWRGLMTLSDRTDRSMIEIGPGAGRTAYYAYRAGITDYTTIDLPMGMVAQACFLGRALGPDKIWLPGDDPRLTAGRIKLLLAGHPPDRTYGLALNTDSLTEMSFDIALEYVKWIRQHCRLFLSINHEINLFTVEQLSAKWFKLSERRPYPMQDGYIEEIFEPRRAPLSLVPWHRLAWHGTKISFRRATASLRRRMGGHHAA
jgi:hypothetical protein